MSVFIAECAWTAKSFAGFVKDIKLKKRVEIKPIALREYSSIAEKLEKRIQELQRSGHKVLSTSFSSFASVVTIYYRKTVWRTIKDWLTKPFDSGEYIK